MAETVASLTARVGEFQELVAELSNQLDRVQEAFNSQLVDIEERMDRLESSRAMDGQKVRGREMTEDQRREVGRRLQQARAEKLGLESIEQLHALKLRPGTKPTKAQVQQVKTDIQSRHDGSRPRRMDLPRPLRHRGSALTSAVAVGVEGLEPPTSSL